MLAVTPSTSAAAMLAAGATACVTEADPRLVAAQLRALWRRFGAGRPQRREDAAAEPVLPAGLADRANHAREPRP